MIKTDTEIRPEAEFSPWPGPDGSPLTPFEWYMVEDDSPNRPMTISFVWLLTGNIDVMRWQTALDSVVKLHPLLLCGVEKVNGPSRYRWVNRSERLVIWEFSETNDNANKVPPTWQNIDLQKSNGAKVAIVRRRNDWLLVLTVHHATTDGIGGFEFCSDLFERYRSLQSSSLDSIILDSIILENIQVDENGSAQSENRLSPNPRLRRNERTKSVSIPLLDERELLDRSIPHPVSRWTVIKALSFEAYQLFWRQSGTVKNDSTVRGTSQERGNPKRSNPTPLTPKSSEVQQALSRNFGSAFQLHPIFFDEDETEGFRRAATNLGCSPHELLLASCLKVFADHRIDGEGKPKGWIAAVIPVNMRLTRDQRSPCHNGIGYAIIKRSTADCQRVSVNAKTFVNDFKAIQQWHLAGLFVDGLRILRRFPVWFSQWVIRNSRPGTFVLSFVGDPARRFPCRFRDTGFGLDLQDCHVVDLAGAPPTRPGTEVALLASFFRNRFTVWLRTDGNSINDATAECLINRIRFAVRATMTEKTS